MVNSTHEAMHRIFREDPGLFARAFREQGLHFPEPRKATVMPTDLTEVEPLERRVDTLMRIEDAEGGEYLLAVEAQSGRDRKKPSSWAYYAAHLHAKYDLPVVLLVVCHSQATARWASGATYVGLPGCPTLTLQPLVLGPDDLPVITEPALAAKDVGLAALSAVAHRTHEDAGAILNALVAAMKTLDREYAKSLALLIYSGLGKNPAAERWRQLMTINPDVFRGLDLTEVLPDYLLDEFREQFRDQVRDQVREEVRDEERAQGHADGVLRILEKRGIAVSEDVRQRVTSCTDEATIDAWYDRALTATTAEDLFREG
jgi:hypothetical protein